MVAFFLSIFGTFVVRSGILNSVHAFALSAIGPYFLTFLGLTIAGSLALFFWRLPRLRNENQLDALLSREGSFLLNNLLFIGSPLPSSGHHLPAGGGGADRQQDQRRAAVLQPGGRPLLVACC